ncbi:MAG: hypothetical protein GWP59_00045 [Chlamydiales bacterium]|nr:hypothetical protein [Chlamydiales bacterium]NCF70071.1 hypothetical protein [Chlamydiales bacterium]
MSLETIEDLSLSSDYESFLFKGKEFTPLVVDYPVWDGNLDAVNVVKIKLDLSLSSDLNFNTQIEQAKQAEEKGLFLWWELDLGLFDRLTAPLDQEAQFLSLEIACKHFNEKVLEPFSASTFALSLFKGRVLDYQSIRYSDHLQKQWQLWLSSRFESIEKLNEQFSRAFKDFDELSLDSLQHIEAGIFERKLFYQDVAVNYMYMLLPSFPANILTFVLQDFSSQSSLEEQLAFSLPDTFEFFDLAAQNAPKLNKVLKTMLWDSCTKTRYDQLFFKKVVNKSRGILLPEKQRFSFATLGSLSDLFSKLEAKDLPFRVISEKFLIEQWEGLDELWVINDSLNPKLQRKLMGFEAAGGEVHYV